MGPSQFLEHKAPNLLTEWLADEDPIDQSNNYLW